MSRRIMIAAVALSLASCGGGDGAIATTAPLAATISTTPTVLGHEFVQLVANSNSADEPQFQWRMLDPATGAEVDPALYGIEIVGADEQIASFIAPDEAVSLQFEVTVVAGSQSAVAAADVDVLSPLPASPVALAARLELGGAGHAAHAAFDPTTGHLFCTDPEAGRVEVFDLGDPSAPVSRGAIEFVPGDVLDVTGTPTGLALHSVPGASWLLVALRQTGVANSSSQPGRLAFVHTSLLTIDAVLVVGPSPCGVALSGGDATYAVVANEGEPSEGTDTEGSFSVVQLGPDGLPLGQPVTADFSGFAGLGEQLVEAGVRLPSPESTVPQDLEPRSIARIPNPGLEIGLPETSYLLSTLQENNALGLVDPAAAEVRSLLPLGTKDWQSPRQPRFAHPVTARLLDLPDTGTALDGTALRLGGFSGLDFVGTVGTELEFLAVTERGPAVGPDDVDGDGRPEVVFLDPDHQARWVRLRHDPATGRTVLVDQTLLSRPTAGGPTPISGLPNFPELEPGLAHNDLEALALDGSPLPLDPFGAMFGAIAVASNGDVWLADRYRPSLYHFNSAGTLIERLVPEETPAEVSGQELVHATLPPVYGKRQVEQGFAGLAIDGSTGLLYAWTAAPLDNPDTADDEVGATTRLARVLGIDPATGTLVSQHLYMLDPGTRIGDTLWSGEPGVFWQLEHNSTSGEDAVARVYRLDLASASDLTTLDDASLLTAVVEEMVAGNPSLAFDPSLEETFGLTVGRKWLIADLASRGLRQFDALDGMTRIDDGRLALITNDHCGLGALHADVASATLSGAPEPASATALILVDFEPLGFDASDADGGYNVAPWPVVSLFQPDGLALFVVDDTVHIVTANEGEPRETPGHEDVVRLGGTEAGDSYALDPSVGPASLELPDQLGRLEVSRVDGDDDADGDFDRIHAFGARSFSVRDSYNRLVFDSGDDLGRWTRELTPEFYNADVEQGTTDQRSDERGVEPSGLVIGEVDGRPMAFIGCERSNGVFVYDLSVPAAPRFVDLLQQAGDKAPEGLWFVPAGQGPAGNALLLVAYAESGSVAVYTIAAAR
jgi:hypothetical protein